MNKLRQICYLVTVVTILLISACRTNKQFTSTQSSSTNITAASIDSSAQHLISTHCKTTSITFLPMQTPALPQMPTPDAQAPAQDLITQLINQGGGTIIIEEEETQTQDQESATTQISFTMTYLGHSLKNTFREDNSTTSVTTLYLIIWR